MRRLIRCVLTTALMTGALPPTVFGDPPAGSGFSLPKEDESFATALEDFSRYCDKKQWETAFRAVTKILDQPTKGFVASDDGILLPSGRRLRTSLFALPPDGLNAYRLFFDAQAKQLLDAAVTAGADDVGPLRKVVDQFFLTASGATAADRLGDAEFEAGNFSTAAEQWSLILDHAPDSLVPAATLYAKRGTALARLGRWDALDRLTKTASDKAAGRTVRIGGRTLDVVAYLRSLRAATTTTPATEAVAAIPGVPRSVAWQSVFMSDSTANEFRTALQQTGWWRFMTGPETNVPPAAVDGRRIYVNWLGVVFAIDLNTGKLAWRTDKFSRFQGQGQMVLQSGTDASAFALAAAGHRLLTVGSVGSRNGGMSDGAALQCLDADSGKTLWSTQSTQQNSAAGPSIIGAILRSRPPRQAAVAESLASYGFVGTPVVEGNTVYAVGAGQRSANMELLALDLEKGEKQWSIPLGTAVAGQNFRGQTQLPVPLLRLDGTTLYVLTNNGALLVIDTAARSVRWALRTEAAEVIDRENMIFFSDDKPEPKVEPPGEMVWAGGQLFLKEAATRTLYAVDPTVPTVLWTRPLEKEEGLALVSDGRLVVAGSAVEAIDALTHALLWSTPLRAKSGQMRPVFDGHRMLIHSARGLMLIDTATGDVIGTFRGADTTAVGANLFISGNQLISVSNRAVTAYPLTMQADPTTAPATGPAH